MSKKVNVTIRIDEEIKNQFDRLLDDLGIGFTAAVNLFIRKSLRTGGIPFHISIDDEYLEFVKLYINSGAVSREELVALRKLLTDSIIDEHEKGFRIKK